LISRGSEAASCHILSRTSGASFGNWVNVSGARGCVWDGLTHGLRGGQYVQMLSDVLYGEEGAVVVMVLLVFECLCGERKFLYSEIRKVAISIACSGEFTTRESLIVTHSKGDTKTSKFMLEQFESLSQKYPSVAVT
jgi:hypothetical protein